MSQLGLSVNEFNRLTEQMKRRFSYSTLEQGWRYYRKQAVSGMHAETDADIRTVAKPEAKTSKEQWITAEVHETKRYRVRFNVKQVKRSECTCQDGGYCKHMAAVFFQLCEQTGGKPELYLAEFRQVYIEEERHRAAVRKRAEQKAELERRKQARQLTLNPSGPAKEWHDFFHKKYGKAFTDFHSPVTDIVKWTKDELYRAAAALPKPIVPLYRMHVLLFLIQQLSIRYRNGGPTGVQGRDAPAADVAGPCMNQLQALAESFTLSSIPSAYEKHVTDLGVMAEAIAFSEEESPVDGLEPFAVLWSTVLNRPEWMEEARQRLERMLAPASALRPRRRDAIRAALLHLEVMLGFEEQAVKRLNELTYYKEPGRYWIYLHEHVRHNRLDRLAIWLEALAPFVRQSGRREDMKQYWQFWERVYEQAHDQAGMESLILTLMPGVYPYLSAFLLDRQRYRDWAEIQLLQRISPEEVAPSELDIVERAAPEVVLPLYHQAVERHIEERSREHYRAAVNLLQRMHRLYENIHSLAVWERYMDGLSDRYSRLRALQEEIKRGALIV